MSERTTRRLTMVAASAAIGTAILYALVGLEVLPVGESTTGEDAGLAGFGAVMAATFAVAALALLRFPGRVTWLAVAALQVLVLVGYSAVAGIRNPPIEFWGLTIKAAQLLILVAVGYLVLRGASAGRTHTGRTHAHPAR